MGCIKLQKVANFLHTSIGYLVNGEELSKTNTLTGDDYVLLSLFHKLSERNQIKLIGYAEGMAKENSEETLNSHKGKGEYDWNNTMNEKPSVSSKEPIRKTVGN